MDRIPLPSAPVFGVAGGLEAQLNANKYLNLDEIFVDCFMENDSDLVSQMGTPGGGGGGGSSGGASSGAGAAGVGAGGNASSIGGNSGGPMGMGPSGLGMGPGGLNLAQYSGPGMLPGMAMQQLLHGPLPPGMGVNPSMPGMPPPPQLGPPMGMHPGMPNHYMHQTPPVGVVGAPNCAPLSAPAPAATAGTTRPAPAPAAGGSEDDGKARRVKRPRTTAGSAAGAAGAAAGMASMGPIVSGRNMSEQQKLDRRERNREHAKRSRVRKKFLLESLQKSVTALQDENEKLRGAIRDNLGEDAAKELLAKAETSSLLAATPGDATKVLDDPDYSLVKALQTAQQNFVITDPTLPDNPIVFASQGFLDLTGYVLDQVLGRNCRFLQGPDTDPKAVEKIRKAIEKGVDTSVCLLNYRVDGSTFWNQFFIAALRDADGKIINYVGVQCKVSEDFVRAIQRQEDAEGGGGEDEDEEDEEDD
ncbi:unnamed protein product [Phaeothamnion confervicola]